MLWAGGKISRMRRGDSVDLAASDRQARADVYRKKKTRRSVISWELDSGWQYCLEDRHTRPKPIHDQS